MQKRKWFRLIKWILIVYGVAGIALYYLQDKIIRHPEPLPAGHKYTFETPYNEINLPFDKNSNINIIRFGSTNGDTSGVVVYLHGNMKNIGYYAKYADFFTSRGYEVWMVDYPGFGKSTGEWTEENLYAYAEQLYKLAAGRFKSDSIIVYGKSLGTGLAAYVASRYPCDRLILESPYKSFSYAASRYFPIYPVSRMVKLKLPTYVYLQNVKCPVTIFHGTNDGVISYDNAAQLKPYLKSSDELITLKDGKHNGLQEFPLFREKLDSLLRLR